ncbi:Formin-like protein [Quillaja saponaria]|uniref:Formin-like protein n=1 Tax=Quillaja saponaria TaxID=32244 RepID=A0AAD7M5L5_QUISA|nr:Formin-like protein [Quillaja saponaria]
MDYYYLPFVFSLFLTETEREISFLFHRKLESPDFQPLPPLSRLSLRQHGANGDVGSTGDDEIEEFYTPKGSLGGVESLSGTGSERNPDAAPRISHVSNLNVQSPSLSSLSSTPDRALGGEEEFYTPKGSLGGRESLCGTGSGSRRVFAAVAGENFHERSIHSSSSSYASSVSGSPNRSHSISLSPPVSLSPRRSLPKSPESTVDSKAC